MSGSYRNVNFYDLVIKARAKLAPPPTLKDVYERCWRVAIDRNMHHEQEHKTVQYRLAAANIDNQHLILEMLIRRSDKNAPNAAYSSFQNGELRVIRKEKNEGGDIAAHLLISMQSHEPNTYLCILEQTYGLSHSRVQRLLSNTVNQLCKHKNSTDVDDEGALFDYLHPSGNGKLTSFIPNIELRGYISEDLQRDLDEGTLSRVTLVQPITNSPIAATAYIIEKEKQLIIKPSKNFPAKGKIATLLSSFSGKRDDYKSMRVGFKDTNEKHRNIEIDLDNGQPVQQMYVKSAKVGPFSPR